jgi:hypothetical protein
LLEWDSLTERYYICISAGRTLHLLYGIQNHDCQYDLYLQFLQSVYILDSISNLFLQIRVNIV